MLSRGLGSIVAQIEPKPCLEASTREDRLVAKTWLARIRRGALVHDLGRVAVPVRSWQKAAPLTPDDWERVRLHAHGMVAWGEAPISRTTGRL